MAFNTEIPLFDLPHILCTLTFTDFFWNNHHFQKLEENLGVCISGEVLFQNQQSGQRFILMVWLPFSILSLTLSSWLCVVQRTELRFSIRALGGGQVEGVQQEPQACRSLCHNSATAPPAPRGLAGKAASATLSSHSSTSNWAALWWNKVS